MITKCLSSTTASYTFCLFFFQAEDGIRAATVTGVQTCALPIFERFPTAPTWLAAMGTSEVSQISAARALFGQTAISGRLPVSVPGVEGLKAGSGIAVPANPMTLRPAGSAEDARLKPAYDVMQQAVADGDFPGGVLAVGYRGRLTVRGFGKQTYESAAPAVRPDTIYDIASLSKSAVTTTLIAHLTEMGGGGRVDLDAPIERYLPEWASGPNSEWRHNV